MRRIHIFYPAAYRNSIVYRYPVRYRIEIEIEWDAAEPEPDTEGVSDVSQLYGRMLLILLAIPGGRR